MILWVRRWLAIGICFSFLVDGLPLDLGGASAAKASLSEAALASLPPLRVSGVSNGEDVVATDVDERVMLDAPSAGEPVEEALEDRLTREREAAPKPEVLGFDPARSVEVVSQRSRFGTVFDNVDGTTTATFDGVAQHYRSASGSWEPIDPRLIAVQDRAGAFQTAASSVLVTVSSDGVEIRGETGDVVRLRPGDGTNALSQPEVSSDGLTATFVEVWPGVDVRFRMSNAGVAKEIVVKRSRTVSAFDMSVQGVTLKQAADGTISTGDDSEFTVGNVEVFDKDGSPVADANAKVSLKDRIDTSVLGLSVSPQWLARLSASDFPVVVDPSWSWWSTTGSYAWSDNASPDCSGNPNCVRPRVGNENVGGDTIWRSVVGWDYSSVQPTSTVASELVSAVVNVSYYSGTTSSQNIALRRATDYSPCGFYVNGDCGQALSTVINSIPLTTGSIQFDVTSVIKPTYWGAGQPNVAWAYSTNEPSGVRTYKELESSITLTYDRLPVIPSTGMWPTTPYDLHDSAYGIHLSIPQLTEPDGETLYYRFVLCNAGCTTIWDDSGWDTIGTPDSTPWDYYSSLYPPGPGLTAAFYNQQLYWTAMVSNSPTGAGFVSYAPFWNGWRLYNTCPAMPQLIAPTQGFVWAPNSPPTFTITPYLDADGDWASYRLLIREQGSSGVVWTSDWTALANSTSPINFTPPASAPLQAGVTYEWSAETRDQTTYFHWYYYMGSPCQAASSFREASFDDRLGSSGPSPMQSVGPVTANLATGNVATAIATPQVSALGGSMGVSMAYNSRSNDIGLRGRFFNDTNGNAVADSSEMVSSRLDRSMTMTWSSPGAVPGITNFIGTWTGYITVPTAGTYHIAAAVGGDERIEVKVGTSYTLQTNYSNATTIPINFPTAMTASSYSGLPYVSELPSTGFTTSGNNTVLPITVTYRNPTGSGYFALYLATSGSFGTFPLTWLSPEARVLPRGWTFNNLDSLGAEYTTARVESTEIVLTRPDGSTVSYTKNGTGYTPPAGEDDIVTYVDGKVTVTTISGLVHSFLADGQLDQVRAPIDAKTPAAPYPTWTTATLSGSTHTTTRMTALTDPITTNAVMFKYEGIGTGACPTNSGLGFVAPSAGMLCRVTYPDSSVTELWYTSDTQGSVVLSRVTNPGNSTIGYPTVDFGYTLVALPAPNVGTFTVPLLSSIRDPLVADAIAAGIITDLADYRTLITYDTDGRATAIAAPKPAATAGGRQKISFDYQISGGITYNETRTRIDGLDNTASSTDWDRKAQFDALARSTYDYQALDATSSTTMLTQTGWDGNSDRPLWTQANNQITRNVYSTEGWVTDTYGPANATCFTAGTFLPNGSCTNPPVPHTSSIYDGGITGLSGSYWPNTTFSGSPTSLATGVGPSYTSLSNVWGAGAPPEAVNIGGTGFTDTYSMRLTGSITFPSTGTYTISVVADDVANVYIDDQLVVAAVCCGSNSGNVVISGPTTKRIRIDYIEYTGSASLDIKWSGTGTGGNVAIPTTALSPRYGLVTSTTTDDSGGAPATTTTTSYTASGIDAIHGLPTSVTTAGLSTTTTYETAGYRRRTARTLPGGNTYSYDYYAASGAGSTAPLDVACTAQNDTTVHQGARLRTEVAPYAADGRAKLTQAVYDVWGRTAATRRGYRVGSTDTWDTTWSCTSFDARNRSTSVTIPARGSYPSRTVTTNYASDPRTTSGSDAAGTITTTTDLLGRVTSYTDVWGQVNTTSYNDVTGRLTTNVGPTGSTGYTYDRAGRLTQQTLDGSVVAVPAYNTPGSQNEHVLASISYPSGVGNAGNGTIGTYTRNTSGSVTGITWTGPGATITSDSVTRSQTGRVIDESIDGVDPYGLGNNFTYDTAGRLTGARAVGGGYYEYQYAATGGCGASSTAGANSNRTAAKLNGTTIGTFCYDNADRLTSVTSSTTPYAGYAGTIAYDAWGNTTTLGGENYEYDGADRHMATYAPNATAPVASVVYQRDITDRIISRSATGTNIDYRSSTTASSGSATVTSLAVNVPSGVVAGDVLLTSISTRRTATTAVVTPPAGWTLANGSAGGGGHGIDVYYRVASGSEPMSYTFGISLSAKAVAAMSAYSGVDTSAPIDATATDTNTTLTTQTAPAATATGSDRMVVNSWAVSGLVTFNPLSDTERTDVATASGTAVSMTTGDRLLPVAGTSGTSTTTSSVAEAGRHVTVLLRPATTLEQHKYIYSATGDTGDAVTDWSGAIIERIIPLPGGASITKRASGSVWSYPNIHGDIQATADSVGSKTGGTLTYDPYGRPLGATVDNMAGRLDNAWLGQFQRPYESAAGIQPTIEMGARPYSPILGRFLRVDPIEGGTGSNDYAYVRDPVNDVDLTGEGEKFWCGRNPSRWGKCRSANSLAERAKTLTNALKKRHGWSERQANAFRHSYWMATIVIKTQDPDFAGDLGRQHENGSKSSDSRTDLHNNSFGISIGFGAMVRGRDAAYVESYLVGIVNAGGCTSRSGRRCLSFAGGEGTNQRESNDKVY